MTLDSSIFDIPIVNNVILYDITDSTNTRAKDFGNKNCVDGTLIISETQTMGKGRIGRSFSSPKKNGIYMSLLLRPNMDIGSISQITLITALAVCDTLCELTHESFKIKWPNDILINNKKVVGILTEANWDTSLNYVVIGIGINVNNDSFPSDISDTATSLYLECHKEFKREDIIYNVLTKLNNYYNEFFEHDNLLYIKDKYNSQLINYNCEVFIIPHQLATDTSNPYLVDTSELKPHLCLGINDNGDLICKDKENNLHIINSGEVSVRGLHGYI